MPAHHNDGRASRSWRRHFGTLLRRLATRSWQIAAIVLAIPCMAQPPGILYSTTIPYTGTSSAFSYFLPTVLLVVTDKAGNTYIAGAVTATGLPTTPGVVQPKYSGGTCYAGTPGEGPCPNGFIAKFNSSGALLFLTYLGGQDAVIPSGLAVDQSGNIYIGMTANGVSYVTRLSPNGSGLGWLTFVGANTSPQLAL